MLAPSRSVFAVTERSRDYFTACRAPANSYSEDEEDEVDSEDDDAAVPGQEGDALGAPPRDLWNCLMQGLGNDYASISSFPRWLDSSKVEPLDWK